MIGVISFIGGVFIGCIIMYILISRGAVYGKCDRYLQEVAVNNEEKKKLREKKAVDNYISIYAVKTREKCLRKYGRTYVKVR